MNERLLQFIWQFQYFNKGELTTNRGEPVGILFTGNYNTNQGPDFSNAMIRIGNTTWAGSVELHIKTSDWNKHQHQHDNNYNNVILHVVWEDDGSLIGVPATATEQSGYLPGSEIPVLALKGRVSTILLQRYEEWMHAVSFIPCEKTIHTVNDITWKSWKERLLVERLLRKAARVELYLAQSNFHWEETCWWLLARNFGISVNADAFEAIARSVPARILAKHKSQVLQLEALLLGQAGMLSGTFIDKYPLLLQREYHFLKEKYQLQPVHQPVHFLRMRPGNFPTIRLAQLAMLISGTAHLFSKLKETESLAEVVRGFDVTANDYWHYHYRFDEPASFKKKKLGSSMTDTIIINTVAPVLFAYGHYHDEHAYKEKAIKWLGETAAETNNITKGFRQLGIEHKNATDSQALTELKNEYCSKKRCLECGIGNAILKS